MLYTARMKYLNRKLFAVLLTFCLGMFFSCSGISGYSVVLWTIPEAQISDGTVVPVYFKSNISHVYVIGGTADGQKIEVPLWKLTEPGSKSKALKEQKRYREYDHQYAKCNYDGLPIRESTTNGAKQVYRLRKDEIIRVLFKGEGERPTNGKEELPGDWLKVLTSDGTAGWCFSMNLRLFAMNSDGSYGLGAGEAEVQEADSVLEQMLSSKWYPDYYSSMIRKNELDLRYMKLSYGFDTGSVSGTVAIHMPNLDVSFPFGGTEKTDKNIYKFKDAPVQVNITGENSITVKYTDEKGFPQSFKFITVALETEGQTVETLISAEQERRTNRYNELRRFGPEFRSSNYGTLSLTGNGQFSWTGFKVLSPTYIGSSARGSGTVSYDYFLPAALKSNWDGIVTLNFTGLSEGVNFFYKKESNGLRLCPAKIQALDEQKQNIVPAVQISQSPSAPVIFFRK